MKRRLFIIVLFVYAIVAGKVMAQTVALDYYFNHETHTTKSGRVERFHYLWEDTANSGFSIWGRHFQIAGRHINRFRNSANSDEFKGRSGVHYC
jgi:hypothetical protein